MRRVKPSQPNGSFRQITKQCGAAPQGVRMVLGFLTRVGCFLGCEQDERRLLIFQIQWSDMSIAKQRLRHPTLGSTTHSVSGTLRMLHADRNRPQLSTSAVRR